MTNTFRFGALGFCLLLVTALLTGPAPAVVKAQLRPSYGIALASGSATASVADYEQAAGRPLDIVHTYHRWFDVFPTASERALAADGHLLLINWEPTDQQGRPMSWAAIAAGADDPQIALAAIRLAVLPRVAISFSHEPELLYGQHGTAAQFAAAFRHVHDQLTADGAKNVSWVWDVMGLADPVWRARYLALWPGDRYVDWVAWDPYNWASCRGDQWQTFGQIVAPFYEWLEAAGNGNKPFMLAEYGTVERPGDAGAKAAWLRAIPAQLAAFPNLRALVYFDVGTPAANCNWQLSTSPSATRAFESLVAAR